MKIYLVGPEKEFSASVDTLQKLGEVLFIKQLSETFTDPEPKILGIAPGFIEWNFPPETLKQIPSLKGIVTKSAWGNYIDIEYCRQNNIFACHVPGANSRSVAEYAFWQMLSLAKKLPQQINDGFKISLDDSHLETEVTGKKMGIIGLGKIGNHLAEMGTAFGMEVWYYSRHPKDVAYHYSSSDEILKNADFVFNCLEICPDTKNYFNQDNLSLLKPTSYFISIMGGVGWGIEDDEFLVKMVEDGKLAGFSIENEHKVSFPSTFSGNVFIPGAYAWYTAEARIVPLNYLRRRLLL